MTRMQFFILVIVAIIAGILGGAASNYYLVMKYIKTQNQPKKTVVAQKFQLVDNYGKTLGSFEIGRDGPSVNLYDYMGNTRAELSYHSIDMTRGHSYLNLYGYNQKRILSVGVVQEEMPMITFYGNNGNVLWEKVIPEKK